MRWALVDFGHPFYRPLVRRIIIFGLVVVWTGIEFFAGSTGWMLLFLALSAYVGWGFFLSGQADGPLEDEAATARTPPPEGENEPDPGKRG
ncbi:hypothetical protein [Hoeflea alexandrii]|uniref:hypothetical protein n=1 Tax=Hoeflea alexandrii TaxID=288436 RepID=UPI0022B00FF2|nr:hypothetical protein [Hoeflea alexandrii]MCZ4288234.1 hypothetical protein [Hoeflea alexandrii]